MVAQLGTLLSNVRRRGELCWCFTPSFFAPFGAMNRTAALLSGLVTLGAIGRAQEFSVLVGGMNAPESGDTSYSWQIDFRQYLSRYTAWSLSWLNEGHVSNHHRDGWIAQ